eukprot:CAMPEP_0119571086 /NCGR_PEP_ID=MMETSP1352-20130426/43942_1 /TAXON_ID=265584 /ORGANISM="Stauroneis constricta, Strain CCMP1120" /LENGTH=232 /DNA_ID=CAMNT_0007620765 /DNA_START=443 /DNA_END=1141 /DNA_ORIENTATION=+
MFPGKSLHLRGPFVADASGRRKRPNPGYDVNNANNRNSASSYSRPSSSSDDDSSTVTSSSWQSSFKRLKVEDVDLVESQQQLRQYDRQQQQYFQQQQQSYSSADHRLTQEGSNCYPDGHRAHSCDYNVADHHANSVVPPVPSKNYQPINSLLGSLHVARSQNRRRSGQQHHRQHNWHRRGLQEEQQRHSSIAVRNGNAAADGGEGRRHPATSSASDRPMRKWVKLRVDTKIG